MYINVNMMCIADTIIFLSVGEMELNIVVKLCALKREANTSVIKAIIIP